MPAKILNAKIPVIYLSLPVIISLGLGFLLYQKYYIGVMPPSSASYAEANNNDCGESFRINGYEYVRPLVEYHSCESPKFALLKENIKTYIDAEVAKDNIKGASVYLENFDASEDWMSVYPNSEYHPGSLGKVPLLITYLKMSETDPGLLNRKITYAATDKDMQQQFFIADSIRKGHTYTVRELLYYTIANSDNNAAVLLMNNIDFTHFKKTYSDLGMNEKLIESNYQFKVREYSLFLEALFNAGYLGMSSSEYALSLLAQCKFKDGILKLLPENTKAIHKFGECRVNGVRELHESAIIYLSDNSAFLITIMTKGNDIPKLSLTMGTIGKMAYDHMSSNSSPKHM